MSEETELCQTIPNQMKQLALKIPERGGERKGAGRKRKATRPRVSHKTRSQFDRATAVLVTLRVAAGVEPAKQALLRSDRTMHRRCTRALRPARHRVLGPGQPPPPARGGRFEVGP